MENNKVIIDLDEYLELRDEVKEMENKINKLHSIAVINQDSRVIYDPLGARGYDKRDVIIKRKDLEKYIADILGMVWCDLKIVEEDENER